MLGIPTIVTGAFVYALWVVNFGFSGYAGAIALAFVMVPLIVRATEEMLRLVPTDIHEASLALGVTQVAHDRPRCSCQPPAPASSPASCWQSRARWVRRRRCS